MIKVGIIHTFYGLKGGEDIIVPQECQLLKDGGVATTTLFFQNPRSKVGQLVSFISSFFNLYSMIKVDKWIKKEKPDVIHIHNWHFASSPSVFWSAKKNRIPVVHTLHNYRILCPSGTLYNKGKIFRESLNRGFPFKAIYQKVYRDSFFQTFWLSCIIRFHRLIGTWRIAAAYIILTPFMKSIFLEGDRSMSLSDFITKPNFVPDTEYTTSKRANNYLYVGRLSEEKGIRMLLQSFSGSSFELKIIGDGPLRDVVERYATNNSNIIFLGPQKKPVIAEELIECTALIFPSVWFEPFGLTIIEAFSYGTPVIASNIGASNEIVINNKNGLHFIAGNVHDLKLKIKEWAEKTNIEKSLFYREARIGYEENYSENKNFEKLLYIYRKVIEPKKNSTSSIST